MNERHRQQPFKSPMLEMELDPERKMWVPGKKKIFIPAIRPCERLFSWDIETVPRVTARGLDFGAMRDFYAMLMADCSPSRGEYLAIPRDTPIRYGDIQRSSEPEFRSSNFIPRRNHLRRNW